MRAFPIRENASLTLIQGRCIEAKIKTFSFLCKKWTFLEFFEFSSPNSTGTNVLDEQPKFSTIFRVKSPLKVLIFASIHQPWIKVKEAFSHSTFVKRSNLKNSCIRLIQKFSDFTYLKSEKLKSRELVDQSNILECRSFRTKISSNEYSCTPLWSSCYTRSI